MQSCQVRTDLALEARESIPKSEEHMEGIKVEEYHLEKGDILVTKVMIETRNASRLMGKPMGSYVTIEAPTMAEPDEDFHQEISECLKAELRNMLPRGEKELSILIVGLGNRAVTADALGPLVLDNLYINRHLVKEYGKAALTMGQGKVWPKECGEDGGERVMEQEQQEGRQEVSRGEILHLVSSLEPGVMAKTGMETAEIIKGVIQETCPDCVIAIDALAARSIKRLSRTVQIASTGIWPGSGVGNHRHALTEETLGVPVIGIGVPLVVDAATIVGDALDKLLSENEEYHQLRYIGKHRNSFAELNNMYMTGKDIDAIVKRVSYTVSEGINRALCTS
ncbi:MAG: GPR endopeptidase [Lachnospiraceae bacterium]|nr:GPR endopeptidase [Lachnospiraceae bacterium]